MTQRPLLVVAMVDSHRDRAGGDPLQVTIGGNPGVTQLLDLLSDTYEIVRFPGKSHRDLGRRVAVLWDFGCITTLPSRLLRLAQGRVVAWSLESPLVAHRAYHRLGRISTQTAHIFGFAGAESLVSGGGARFHAIVYPVAHRPQGSEISWSNREFLVSINSNKPSPTRPNVAGMHRITTGIRPLASALLWKSYSLRKSWSVPDFYQQRITALRHFSGRPGVALYGVGWDEPIDGLTPAESSLIRSSYRGPVRDKLQVLSRFQYSLCFENTSFPGYVSEKIFDCLLAGTIPVYLGAPDISRYVPARCFVDAREFPSYAGLEQHLLRMSNHEVRAYRKAAGDFLRSPGFERHAPSRFVHSVKAAIDGLYY